MAAIELVLKVLAAWVGETDMYQVNEEDGPAFYFDYVVYVEAADGKVYVHQTRSRAKGDAESLLARVESKGEISTKFWIETRQRESYQEACESGSLKQWENDHNRIYG